MANPDTRIFIGQLVEEEVTLSVDELSGICAVERSRIVELVEQGLLELQAEDRLGGDALRRARMALRLQRDLGVNAAGVSLVVELLDRIAALEAHVRALDASASTDR